MINGAADGLDGLVAIMIAAHPWFEGTLKNQNLVETQCSDESRDQSNGPLIYIIACFFFEY